MTGQLLVATSGQNLVAANSVGDGSASAVVPAEWLGSFAGEWFDWDVVLEVGAPPVVSCEVSAFGQTGAPG
jgi:hypothetical protein